MILMKGLIVVAVMLTLGHNTDAVRMKNNSGVLFHTFIFCLHIPLILIFVSVVFLYLKYRKRAWTTTIQPSASQPSASQPAPAQPAPAQPAPAAGPSVSPATFQRRAPRTPETKTRFYFEVPSCWIKRPGDPLQFTNITDDSKSIKTLLYSLWDPQAVGIGRDAKTIGSYKYIHIQKVLRVENAGLYQQYNLKRDKMKRKEKHIHSFKDLGNIASNPVLTTFTIQSSEELNCSDLEKDIDHNINEHYLFHGTKTDRAESICRQGLSTFYISRTMFGDGVYLAEHPNKSDQYTDSSRYDNTLLLCRTCLGEIYVQRDRHGAGDFELPPCRICFKHQCPDHKWTCDSLVADISNLTFREYVLYRDYRVYPEYMIKYDRTIDDTEMRKYL